MLPQVPEGVVSTADLQGFFMTCKNDPETAVAYADEWVASITQAQQTHEHVFPTSSK